MFNKLGRSMAAGLGIMVATVTHAQTFSNAAPIAVPAAGNDGKASPYPTSIDVSGVSSPIATISITLHNFTHTWIGDVVVLLVAPNGQGVLVLSRAGDGGDAINSTVTFSADATAIIPETTANVPSGVYACSVYSPLTSLPSPAPTGPYSASLASLFDADANGTWSLYAIDGFPSVDSGSIAGGWSITFNEPTPSLPVTSAFTYQGVLTADGTPVNGDANVRFTLCNNATRATLVSGVAPPITKSFTGVVDGLISAPLDFGSAIDVSRALWLNIEVESPPGSGFVAVTPRQAIAPTPQARFAQFSMSSINAQNAVNAQNAQTANSATQLAPGRARILGGAGAVSTSPGIWFASPIATPIDRAFIGMLDNSNVGLYNNGWSLLAHSNGNVAIGDPSGNAPPERLTVNGGIQINTSNVPASLNALAFGAIGNQGDSADNTDAVYFQRVNTGVDTTELRLIIGDDPGLGGPTSDSLRICTTSVGGGLIEQIRFQSDGIALKPGGGSWGVLSDPRAKHDIAPLSGTLDKLLNLRGYSFQYNDDRVASGVALPGVQVGLMADEVAQVFPDWVSTDASGTRFVTERSTTALMVEALRDLRAEKDAATAAAQMQIDVLRAQNAELQARLEKLEAAINATKP